MSIDFDKCVGCSDRVKSCVYDVLEIIDNVAYPVKLENSKGCKNSLQEYTESFTCEVLVNARLQIILTKMPALFE